MATMVFHYPTAASPSTSWTATRNPAPESSSIRHLLRGRMGVTAGGTARGQVIHANDRQIRHYEWPLMDGANYDDLEDFFITTTKGGAESFQVVDEYGGTVTARFMPATFTRVYGHGTTLATSVLHNVGFDLWVEP